ncbi:MAG: aldo/keto reductase [Candidatus Hodarchaeales archaeon]
MWINYGVNYIDVAPSYGEAEVRVKKFLEKNRNKVFLAEKTMQRTQEGAWKELHESRARLGVDYFDLYQFHAIPNLKDLSLVLQEKNGALVAFQEAKETGLIGSIGITCHDDVKIIIRALNEYDGFDTVLFPVYATGMITNDSVNDFYSVLKLAKERDLGVIAIKSLVRRRWIGESNYNTWYEPFDDPDLISQLVAFTLSQEGVTTYPLPCDIKLWKPVLEAGKNFNQMDEESQMDLIQFIKSKYARPLFPI